VLAEGTGGAVVGAAAVGGAVEPAGETGVGDPGETPGTVGCAGELADPVVADEGTGVGEPGETPVFGRAGELSEGTGDGEPVEAPSVGCAGELADPVVADEGTGVDELAEGTGDATAPLGAAATSTSARVRLIRRPGAARAPPSGR
jgi:hypothetical protein